MGSLMVLGGLEHSYYPGSDHRIHQPIRFWLGCCEGSLFFSRICEIFCAAVLFIQRWGGIDYVAALGTAGSHAGRSLSRLDFPDDCRHVIYMAVGQLWFYLLLNERRN